MTAASASLSPSSTESSWVDLYEHLRERGVEPGSRSFDDAQGLVLFLREGMVSWMSELVAATQEPPAAPSPSGRGVFVHDDRVEVTWMLASMVESALGEMQP